MGSAAIETQTVNDMTSPGDRKTRSPNHETEETYGSDSFSSCIDNIRQRSNRGLDRSRQFVEPLLETSVSKRSSPHHNRNESDEANNWSNTKKNIFRPTISGALRASIIEEKKRKEKVKNEKMGSATIETQAVNNTSPVPEHRATRSSNNKTEDNYGSASASIVSDSCRQRQKINRALDRTRNFVEPLQAAPVYEQSSTHDNQNQYKEANNWSNTKTNILRPTITGTLRASVIEEKKRKEKVKNEKMRSATIETQAVNNTSPVPEHRTTRSSNNKTEDNYGSASASLVIDSCRQRRNRALDRTRQFVDPPQAAPVYEHSSTHDNQNQYKEAMQGDSEMCQENFGMQLENENFGNVKPKRFQTIKASPQEDSDNLQFYQNRIPSKHYPGFFIEDILKWKGDYRKLEKFNCYITWLFPVPAEGGMHPLSQREKQVMRDDKTIQKRLLKSYEMMLDFYGMKIDGSRNGIVRRKGNWKERYDYLNRCKHGFVYIYRIIQTLGELGFERFQAPFVDLLVTEVVVTGELRVSNDPWLIKLINAVKDAGDREVLLQRAFGFGRSTTLDTESEDGDEITIEERDVFDHKDGGTDYERGNGSDAMHSLKLSKENDAASAEGYAEGQSYCYTTNDKCDRNIVDENNSSRNCDEVGGKVFEKGRVMKTKSEEHLQSYTCLTAQDEFGRKYKETPHDSRVLPYLGVHKYEQPNENCDLAIDTAEDQNESLTSSPIGKIETKATREIQNNLEENLPCENLLFYQDKLLSKPSPGYSIEAILKHKGDYKFFDEYPYYIQWLFPIPYESLRNPECPVLHEYEAKAIREDSEMSRRVVNAYQTVLDYLGLQLEDENFGTIKPISYTFDERFQFVSKNPQYYRGITRVLTSLGELGYERFQVPLIDFLIHEGIDGQKLPSLQGEHILHWFNAVKDEGEKQVMFKKYQNMTKQLMPMGFEFVIRNHMYIDDNEDLL